MLLNFSESCVMDLPKRNTKMSLFTKESDSILFTCECDLTKIIANNVKPLTF